MILGFTSPVFANTWILLGHSTAGTYTVKMVSKDQCETQGQRFIYKKTGQAIHRKYFLVMYV